jgi:hypothetical protein
MPFANYPSARYRRWHLLQFEFQDVIKPNAASLGIFKGQIIRLGNRSQPPPTVTLNTCARGRIRTVNLPLPLKAPRGTNTNPQIE